MACFHSLFCDEISYNIPLEYFRSGDCYALFVGGKMTGGYCLVHLPAYRLRSIEQIPHNEIFWMNPKYINMAEFTGYFIKEKRYGFLFTLHLVKTILFHKADWFVYSYPVSQKALGRYYGKGRPIRLFVGPPEQLEGHTSKMESESVELLTKTGIVRIFLHRTFKFLKGAIYGKRARHDGAQGKDHTERGEEPCRQD